MHRQVLLTVGAVSEIIVSARHFKLAHLLLSKKELVADVRNRRCETAVVVDDLALDISLLLVWMRVAAWSCRDVEGLH